MPYQAEGQGNTLSPVLKNPVSGNPVLGSTASQSKKADGYPSLYQVNIRVALNALSKSLGRSATLDDLPDSCIETWADQGFDWIWLLSVWQTGPEARAISRSHVELRYEFQRTLPDLTIEDVEGSGFAIQAYQVHASLGGNDALVRFRKRMQSHGLKLILDYVPNHVAPDHRWVKEQPDLIVQGTEKELEESPHNYRKIATPRGEIIFAHGRDPYFAGWTDTLQLNYGNPALQSAMLKELMAIAELCDGVRCDMAMLLLPDVFQRTWGVTAEPYWPNAIRTVKEKHRNFLFMAEVYWGRESELMQQGFDYCYDKELYDRLRGNNAESIRNHLKAEPAFQNHLVRFLENHDEPRAATAFNTEKHMAAAAIAFLIPSLRFFHYGQLEGRKKKISPHLVRLPTEPTDERIFNFYQHLLKLLGAKVVRAGQWSLVDSWEAWPGNPSFHDIISFEWRHADGARLLVVVNYADHISQARLRLQTDNLPQSFQLKDLANDSVFTREVRQVANEGLYVELAGWGTHLFQIG